MAKFEKHCVLALDELLASIEIQCEQCKTGVRIGSLPDEINRGLFCPRCESGKGPQNPVYIAGSEVVVRAIRLLQDIPLEGRARISARVSAEEPRTAA